jgi:hypothetical protein
MTYGLTNWQIAYIVSGLASVLFTGIWYIMQYDEERYEAIAAQAHAERLKNAREEFGRITSGFYTDIGNHANYYEEDLEEEESASEAAKNLLNGGENLERLEEQIRKAREPSRVHSRCQMGAFYAPLSFIMSLTFSIPWLITSPSMLATGSFLLTCFLFILGGILLAVHLYYSRKIHKYSSDQSFIL